MFNTIGIVGMGLIGGSLAKLIKKKGNTKVYCYDINENVVTRALDEKVADEVLNKDNMSKCDLVIVALYPLDIIDFIKKNADNFKKGAIITDICGIKGYIKTQLEDICKEKKLVYIGTHPMAGKEFAGFENSSSRLFHNASMIITGEKQDKNVKKLKLFYFDIGFKRVVITSTNHHDAVIAYTSQLAHIVSSAYVKSPTAREFSGFSAGSFKDLTRVAKLNPSMWTDLFLCNKDNLVCEISTIINYLEQYKTAIENEDKTLLFNLLKDGNDIKEELNRCQ